MKCSAIRTGQNPKKMPGQQKVYRCRNDASRVLRIHQHPEHARVGPHGWFDVVLCESCFFASDSGAIVNLEGRQKFRWAR